MACIKSASRSALVALAPDASYLAAGTLAGAVDLSFSSSANLEIFSLDFTSDGQDLPLAGSCPSTERFNRLSWGKPGSLSEEYCLGLIAGGLGDGSISIWNPKKLISSDDIDGAFVARLDKHLGPVRGLEFSSLSPNLLASGADEGELCIWDLTNPLEPNLFPSLKNPGSGSQGEISFASWNPKFQHILASTSYNGLAVVWDLRKQKPLTSFSDSSKRRCSVLQWNPDISTQLIVASDDDASPSLKLWDVRKTISPIKEFVGHNKGVIAMSWCPNDSSLLLTCAKDNRTICWDTFSGQIISELPASTNWNFDIHWYSKIPGIISASSFDGKIGIYNIEACGRSAAGSGDFNASAHLRAPKWLKRPVGVSFGFGGKLVSFKPSSAASGSASSGSEVYVHHIVTENVLVNRSTEFEAAIHTGERSALRALCEKKSDESEIADDREAWGFLKVMFEDEGTARTKLLGHLGFSVPSTANESEFDEHETYKGEKVANLSQGEEESAFHIDNGEEFFNNIQPSQENLNADVNDGSNGEQVEDPHRAPGTTEASLDESILRALVVDDYKGAVCFCISANRVADALVIAHASGSARGPALWERTRNQYLKSSHLPYLKVISALVNNDLMSLINMRPLNSWKETLALLCTFAQKEEWTILCDTLGSRLLVDGNTLGATLCYICAGNIDKTVEIWSQKLSSECGGRAYVDTLQDLMEKTIVLALATGQKQFSAPLSKLIENYAELLVSQGLLKTAMDYLKILGLEDSSSELVILRDRISLSTEERELPTTFPSDNTTAQVDPVFVSGQQSLDHSRESLQYYPDNLQGQHPASLRGAYGEAYQQPIGSYGSYQPVVPKKQFPEYVNSVPFQPAASTQMFIPSQISQAPQMSSAPPVPQPAVKPFVPSTPPTLRNVEQFQQGTLASHIYAGSVASTYQPGPHGQASLAAGLSQPPNIAEMKISQPMAPAQAPRGFSPITNPSFVQSSLLSSAQPSSPTQITQTQSINPPSIPSPTVQTVDTSNVSADLRPVVTTLTRLYKETSEALGGARANPAKKREIDDNSRKIGSLFAKLNNQDISSNAASKLVQLCQLLDSGDFAGALHIQVILTTSDWDECNFWLSALKRMIKTRQSMRPH